MAPSSPAVSAGGRPKVTQILLRPSEARSCLLMRAGEVEEDEKGKDGSQGDPFREGGFKVKAESPASLLGTRVR